MKSLIVLSAILLSLQISAQDTYSLWKVSSSKVPKYSYLKDIEKRFDPYIGTWQGDFNGKKVVIVANKEKVLDEKTLIYRDKLVIRYEIRDKSGKIIESTLGKEFHNRRFKIEAWVFREDLNKMMGVFYGGKCNLGIGPVYLGLPNGNKMTWSYRASTILLTDDMVDKCTGDVNLPEAEGLVFTKQ